jgi:hypothetical protein
MCPDDVLTDRWPANLSDQAVFIQELKRFADKLERLSAEIALPEMQKILEELFGEKPAQSAVKAHVARVGTDVNSNGSRYLPGTATIPAAIAGMSSAPSTVKAAPSHRFFGDHPDELPKRR